MTIYGIGMVITFFLYLPITIKGFKKNDETDMMIGLMGCFFMPVIWPLAIILYFTDKNK